MTRLLTALLAAALFAGFAPVRAEDKKDPKDDKAKPTGVWSKEADGLKLSFDFSKPDVVIVIAGAGENTLTLTSKYKIEKDGLIKATTSKIEVKGEFPVKPKDGYNFEFKIKIDGKKAKISDFSASEDADKAKEVVEGEYTKEEKKDK
jgi:hypothetical protein